jgi:hypothetical protein
MLTMRGSTGPAGRTRDAGALRACGLWRRARRRAEGTPGHVCSAHPHGALSPVITTSAPLPRRPRGRRGREGRGDGSYPSSSSDAAAHAEEFNGLLPRAGGNGDGTPRRVRRARRDRLYEVFYMGSDTNS